MNEMILLSDVSKSYGKARGICGVSLKVEKGDIYGFMGPNGAGKSTTIKSMLGLITPDAGKIEIFQKEMRKEKVEILKRIGYMPSEAMFYTGMKVVDILNFSAKMRGKDCKKQQDLLCERLDLDRKKKIETLSLGNRKKVSIVCAMQHEPDLYVLDEPTSGLDPLIQKEFFDLLLEKQQIGATIFLSSHILTEVKNYCTKAAIIKEGCVIREDSIEHLLKSSVRNISICGLEEFPKELLDNHVKNISIEKNQIKFLYDGQMKDLIHILEAYPITDFIAEEANIEEVFLHYYEKEEN